MQLPIRSLCLGLSPLLTAWTIALIAQPVVRIVAQGDSLIEAGRASNSIEVFEKALRTERSSMTLTGRGRGYYAVGKYDKAQTDADQALKLDSTYAPALYLSAQLAQRNMDVLAAEAFATKAIASARDSVTIARAHLLRGDARAVLKRYSEAVEDLEIGTAKLSWDIEHLKELARLYDQVRRHEDALRVLERLCDMEPTDMGHWVNRAYELAQLERYPEALDAVQRALLMDKDEPIALGHRAYIHMKMGRDQEAWNDVERSLRNFAPNAYALRTRALLRLKRGDSVKACNDLTYAQALEEIPEVERLIQQHCQGQGGKSKR